MNTAKTLTDVLCTAAALTFALPVAAQQSGGAVDYPNRPIRMVMPYPPGGPVDILGRLIAQPLTEWSKVITAADIRIE